MLKIAANTPLSRLIFMGIFAVFLVSISLITSVQGSALLHSEALQASPDSIIHFPVQIEGIRDLGALDLIITYNRSVLTFQQAEKKSVSSQAIFAYNETSPGRIKISIVDPQGISNKGTILDLTFRVIGQSGSFSEISMTPIKCYDINLNELYLEAGKGKVDVVSGSKSTPLSGFSVICACIIIILFFRINRNLP